MPKTKKEEITPTEALQILQSALGYCQRSGLGVTFSKVNSELFIEIDGADFRVEEGEVILCLSQPEPGVSAAWTADEIPVKVEESPETIDVDDK